MGVCFATLPVSMKSNCGNILNTNTVTRHMVQRQKREANFGLLLRHWIMANPLRVTCHFELKQTTTDSMPFSCVEERQIDFGHSIQNSPKGVLMRNTGGSGEPDYTYTYRDPVFIVIRFPDIFCIISLASFVHEKSVSKRKSLTSERARELSTHCIELHKR